MKLFAVVLVSFLLFLKSIVLLNSLKKGAPGKFFDTSNSLGLKQAGLSIRTT
jgi:hypothetical protein